MKLPTNPRFCGAKTRGGGECHAPAMTNGRCRIHGGKATGPENPYVKHGLYRKRLDVEEQLLFDALTVDPDFDNLKREIAMVRLVINRCFIAIVDEDDSSNWRVPMQVLPSYVEKLLKLIERMKPIVAHQVLEDHMDRELQVLISEESHAQELQRLGSQE